MASQWHVKEEPVRRRRCGNCGKLGHSRSTCPYSKLSKIYVHDEIKQTLLFAVKLFNEHQINLEKTYEAKEIHVENRLRLFSTDIMSEKNKQSLFFSPEIQHTQFKLNRIEQIEKDKKIIEK